jgi:Subtilase family
LFVGDELMLCQLNRAVRSARRMQNSHSLAPAIEELEKLQLLSALPVPSGLTPAEIRSYYGFNHIEFSIFSPTRSKSGSPTPVIIDGDGSGQTIAILDKYSDPDIVHDVKVFDSQFHLPAANLTVDPLTTAVDPTGGWEDEESLDVEWAHAIAPGAAIVVVNYAPGPEINLLNAVNAAKNYPGVSVVSMSLGGNEFPGELADDSYFTSPSNHGGINVSFVASSGDDYWATSASGPGPGPLFPSSSPNVLAVGGTVLTLSPKGDTEDSWQDSEGGQSQYEPEPYYQYQFQQTGFRTTPDVADVATNLDAYDSYPYLDAQKTVVTLGWHTPEGTSLAAPQWAGLIAIANQGRVFEGEPTLSDVPDVLYRLPSADFNKIVNGPADQEGNSPEPDYSEITGLGSPKANLLAQELLHPPGFVIPPIFMNASVSVGDANGPGSAPQGMLGEFALGNSSHPTHVVATSQPVGPVVSTVSPVAAISSDLAMENSLAQLPAGDLGADGTSPPGPMSSLANVTPPPAFTGGPSVDLGVKNLSPPPATGSPAPPHAVQFHAALVDADSLQWAGLNAALDVLGA